MQPKYFNNKDTFPPGYSTPDDHWDNYWRHGRNALLGWDSVAAGIRRRRQVARPRTREQRRVRTLPGQKVFKNVCFRAPSDTQDRAQVHGHGVDFKSNGYQLKRVFAEAAIYCMGD